MKVVFIKDLPGRAKRGEIKEVADGYARNFLLPRGLAVLATSGTIHSIQTRREQITMHQAQEQEKLKEIAHNINGKQVILKARAGAQERLFGSVTTSDIAQALSQLVGFNIDKRKIELDEPLRKLGNYEIIIRLSKDVEAKITVIIEEEKVKT